MMKYTPNEKMVNKKKTKLSLGVKILIGICIGATVIGLILLIVVVALKKSLLGGNGMTIPGLGSIFDNNGSSGNTSPGGIGIMNPDGTERCLQTSDCAPAHMCMCANGKTNSDCCVLEKKRCLPSVQFVHDRSCADDCSCIESWPDNCRQRGSYGTELYNRGNFCYVQGGSEGCPSATAEGSKAWITCSP